MYNTFISLTYILAGKSDGYPFLFYFKLTYTWIVFASKIMCSSGLYVAKTIFRCIFYEWFLLDIRAFYLYKWPDLWKPDIITHF